VRVYDNSSIIAYLKRSASTTIKNRGKTIFKSDNWRIVSSSRKDETAHLKVSNATAYDEYDVRIYNIFTKKINSTCTCPYDWGPVCKHQIAALMVLEDDFDSIFEEPEEVPVEEEIVYADELEDEEVSTKTDVAVDNKSIVKLSKISHLINYANTSGKLVSKAETYIKFGYVEKLEIIDAKATVEVFDGVKWYSVSIERKDNAELEADCNCSNTEYKLCEHKIASLLFIRKLKGEYVFEQLKDHSLEKQELLAEYGFTLEDKWQEKFRFTFQNGRLSLKVLDKSIQKITSKNEWTRVAKKFAKSSFPVELLSSYNLEEGWNADWEMGYGFYFSKEREVPDVNIIRLVGKVNDDGNRFKSGLKDFNEVVAEVLPPQDETSYKINYYLNRLSKYSIANHFGQEESSYFFYNNITEDIFLSAQAYLLGQYNKLMPFLEERITGELIQNKPIKRNNFNHFDISMESPKLSFELTSDDAFIYFRPWITVQEEKMELAKLNRKSFLFIQYEDTIHCFDSVDTAALVQTFTSKKHFKINRSAFWEFYTDFLIPLMKKYDVQMDIELNIELVSESTLEKEVYIEEKDDYLVFRPKLKYNDEVEVDLYGNEKIIIPIEGSQTDIKEIIRNLEKENDFKEQLESLHPEFANQTEMGFYALQINQLLKGGWFFQTFEFFRENEITVFGFEKLQKFKYNQHKPEFNIQASSGIDWFDVKMEVRFGDQIVDLKTLQKAMTRNENYVRLGDGTLGLLPEDWIKENAILFKMGEVEKDTLKVSKLHFSLVDILFDQIDNEDLIKELETKKQKLLNFDKIELAKKPDSILAELRDYQDSGYSWMCFLDEFGWGGCLADDMGLGKTLQVLTFLQSRIDINPNQTSLIILPTSLIFNWQDEIRKFSPDINYLIHRGADRAKTTDDFKNHHLIITTYGILVRDTEILKEFDFNYIVLDESQAIKNPNSKRYKAVRLLKSYNRLVLTGTPVENNTFDLFAQMNFLNPGLLGSMRFFKEEFSKPIDREGDKNKVEQLKKLVYPFLLRRTKAQVATELPEKTESLLFCEMGEKQRKVYDNYKNLYRDSILKKIKTDGINKTRFHVLEGLLKLRQICDSPNLVNNVEGAFDEDSIKIKMLSEHVKDKTGQHKILIFSQFVKMLQLIKTKLEKEGVILEYLDGSCKPHDREASVKRFQSDETCRVFLISLKAGGVGLNLTEADYVYLVDPWWNPAVESQAIDRTHRIGQNKKVFSYKMICKDSIEEKVLKLQDRKKALVTDLISAESSFIKSLEREDIEDLFG